MEELDTKFVLAASLLADYCKNSTVYLISDDIFNFYTGEPFTLDEKFFLCCAAYIVLYWRSDCECAEAIKLRDLIDCFLFERLRTNYWSLNKKELEKVASKFRALVLNSPEELMIFFRDAPLDEILTTKEVARLAELFF